MKLIRLQIIIYAFLLLYITSCKKFLEVPPPADALISESVFATDVKANSVITSIYGSLENEFTFASFYTTLLGSLSSDELTRYNPTTSYSELNENALNAENSLVTPVWTTAYKSIYNTNAAIEGLQRSTNITDSLKSILIHECRFLRAFSYFYLVNFFGDVPLITQTDYKLNALVGRTSAAIVYQFIIEELIDCSEVLPAIYKDEEKGRAGKWAARALLARCYLYTKDWKNAVTAASSVIESNLFTPLKSPNEVFLKNSMEAIWQLIPDSGRFNEITQLGPSGSNPRNYFSPQLMESFEHGDLRRNVWIDSITRNSVMYYYPGKYKNTSSATFTEYHMVMRVAEQYLIRAEANVYLKSLSAAKDDLNVVRSRGGLADTNASNEKELLSAIEQERRIELMAEWGHRWFDLKRTGRAKAQLSSIKPSWQDFQEFYPIPISQLTYNPNLQQNPGY